MTVPIAVRVAQRFRRASGGPSRRSRGRFSRLAALLLALGLLGGAYTAFAPASEADDQASSSNAAAEGEKLYNQGCISCHGRNAQGVPNRGPSLLGVGSAAVEFQVGTGRMPLVRQEAQGRRKQPQYNEEQAAQLGAYIQSLGGGPQVPNGELRDEDAVAEGGKLFRVNCASCHAFSGNGAPLSSGKFAPPIGNATDRQVYAAMLTGPQSMPVFGDNHLTPEQKKAIIAYVQSQNEDTDPGGFGIGRSGPVPEGLVVFVIGIAALLVATLWIAGKS